jgi:DNA-binding Lrp family transcriptional regulator
MKREARYRLPGLLAELLGTPEAEIRLTDPADDQGADVIGSDGHGRMWLIQVKSAGSPAQVGAAASEFAHSEPAGHFHLLVVPSMSRTGAEIAARFHINWVDLSGNADIYTDDVRIHVEGRPNHYRARGRPSSPFAPRSSRVARTFLLNPAHWWQQKDLAEMTGLSDGSISRIVRRLESDALLERRDALVRPHDPGLLLDAWSEDYRFDRHDIVTCHISGSGPALAKNLTEKLRDLGTRHAFTGLPAAWALDEFAMFRLVTVYIDGDPRQIVGRLDARRSSTGANVQLVGPNDDGVFMGEQENSGLPCVSAVQAYLDLRHLPERASDAAEHLRGRHLGWRRGSSA